MSYLVDHLVQVDDISKMMIALTEPSLKFDKTANGSQPAI